MCRFAYAALVVALCFAGGVRGVDYGCGELPQRDFPFCNESLAASVRAHDLVGRLTLEEKSLQLATSVAPGIGRLGIPQYEYWSEALHGLGVSPGVSFEGSTPFATSFPQIIGVAASFNLSMVHDIGLAISNEARAFSNAGHAGNIFFTPNVNLFRDSRWGRGQETPGECPYLTRRYAETLVRALQNRTDESETLKMAVTCKHFAAYSLEKWNGTNRHHFDAEVSPEALTDAYLPAFEVCVRTAKVASVMCSYNAINGVPACANSYLLNTILREQFEWNGFVSSDCGAIWDIAKTHNYTTSFPLAAAAALKGGCDVDCGFVMPLHTQTAVRQGDVSEAVVDRSLERLFSARMQLGLFDAPAHQQYAQISPSAANSPAHKALALRAAQATFVLLQNAQGTLPVSRASVKSVGLIGPNGNSKNVLLGNYFGLPESVETPLMALDSLEGVSVEHTQGCTVGGTRLSDVERAEITRVVASSHDLIVLAVGLDESLESEGHDRTSLELPEAQWEMIELVRDLTVLDTHKRVVMIVFGGGMVDLTRIKKEQRFAVLWVGYPGQSGGSAIVSTLFGDSAPAGRLPVTMYPAAYVNEMSMFDMSFTKPPGRTYRYYTGKPVFPFGHGLTYAPFTATYERRPSCTTVTTAVLASAFASPSRSLACLSFAVRLNNTHSTIASDYTLLTFAKRTTTVKSTFSSVTPLRSLCAFSRTHVPAQQSRLISTIEVDVSSAFSLVSSTGSRYFAAGRVDFLSADDSLLHTIQVTGPDVVVYSLPPQ